MAREVALPLELEEERGEPRRRRWRRLLQTARRHPLGVFGLICVSLLFFCGIFADLIVPYDPIAVIREKQTFGSLSEPIDAKDDTLRSGRRQTWGGNEFNIDDERMLVVPPDPIPSGEGTIVNVQRASTPTAHAAGTVLELDTAIPTQSPSWSHPFGTDHNSRDVLSRTIFGARISLLIGLTAVITGVSSGAAVRHNLRILRQGHRYDHPAMAWTFCLPFRRSSSCSRSSP